MSALLSLHEVSVCLGARRVISNASLDINRGEFVGLIGPNGAGKSTLLKTAAGLLPADAGACRSAGTPLRSLTARERARRIAYLPQARPVFWSVTAREIIALGRFSYGAPLGEAPRDSVAIDRAMNEAGAAPFSDRPAAELSGGELARVHLARALAGETPLLLADEPIAALDPAHQLSVMALLRAKADEGRAVIAALHDLSLAARYCTRLVILGEGRVAADGAPKDVLTPSLLREVFNVDAAINTTPDGLGIRLRPL